MFHKREQRAIFLGALIYGCAIPQTQMLFFFPFPIQIKSGKGTESVLLALNHGCMATHF